MNQLVKYSSPSKGRWMQFRITKSIFELWALVDTEAHSRLPKRASYTLFKRQFQQKDVRCHNLISLQCQKNRDLLELKSLSSIAPLQNYMFWHAGSFAYETDTKLSLWAFLCPCFRPSQVLCEKVQFYTQSQCISCLFIQFILPAGFETSSHFFSNSSFPGPFWDPVLPITPFQLLH